MISTLTAEHLAKSYQNKKAVSDVSLKVNSGQIVSLLGPNGAGKTTTFYIISGLIQPDQGTIFLDQTDISNFPIHKRAQLGIGYLPQEVSIFRGLSVYDNLIAVLEFTALSKQQQQKKANLLLSEFNLEHVKDTLGLQLSGGERRRVEIARALATEPKFILLDEPFAGVDPISVGETKALIQAVAKKNIGIIITDHNVRETLSICDLAYILNQGELIATGTPKTIIEHPQVKQAYLGNDFNL